MKALELLVNAIETVQFRGEDHLKVPVVGIIEGVFNGNLITADAFKLSVNYWNGRAVTVGHPKSGDDFVSVGLNPEIYTQYATGLIFDSSWNQDKKRFEAYLYLTPETLRKKSSALLTRLQSQQKVEVSTGFGFMEGPKETGTYDGKEFKRKLALAIPDHLALLEGIEGACSVKDGCGSFQVHVIHPESNQPCNCRGVKMDKNELIAQLIANEKSPFEDADKEQLEAFSDERLQSMVESYKAEPAPAPAPAAAQEPKGVDMDALKDMVTNAVATALPDAIQTSLSEAVAQAIPGAVSAAVKEEVGKAIPAQATDFLSNLSTVADERRKALTEQIVKTSGLTEDELKSFSLQRLEELHRANLPSSFVGRGGVSTQQSGGGERKPFRSTSIVLKKQEKAA